MHANLAGLVLFLANLIPKRHSMLPKGSEIYEIQANLKQNARKFGGPGHVFS